MVKSKSGKVTQSALLWAIGIFVSILILLFINFPYYEQEDVTAGAISSPITDSGEVGESKSVGVKEFFMTARKWDFSPSVITVHMGDTVLLHIESVDVNHGFFLEGFGVDELLQSGRTVDIEFVADKRGEFTFFCSVFCGSGHSTMDGTLIVE